jgi:hypothetical protein
VNERRTVCGLVVDVLVLELPVLVLVLEVAVEGGW